MTSRTAALAGALVLLLSVGGCGQPHDDDVRGVATRFYEAYTADDGAAACAVLAPRTRSELEQSAGKPCDEAVLEEDVPRTSTPLDVHVFGTQARVKWDGETTFLARFQGGWKVMAAACTPQPDMPYDCTISGG